MPFGYNLLKRLPNHIRKFKKYSARETVMTEFDFEDWAFDESVTNEQIISIALYAIATYSLIIAVCWNVMRTRKQLAWCISLVNSLSMSLTGFIYLYFKIPRHLDHYMTGDQGHSVFHSMDNIGIVTCTVFAVSFSSRLCDFHNNLAFILRLPMWRICCSGYCCIANSLDS
jgi:uncharacterized protein YPO0396